MDNILYQTRRSARLRGKTTNDAGGNVDESSAQPLAMQTFDPLKIKELGAHKKVSKPKKKTLKQSKLMPTIKKSDKTEPADSAKEEKPKRKSNSSESKTKKKQKIDDKEAKVIEKKSITYNDQSVDKDVTEVSTNISITEDASEQTVNDEPENFEAANNASKDSTSINETQFIPEINKEAPVACVDNETSVEEVEQSVTIAESSFHSRYERSVSPPSFASFNDEPVTPLNHFTTEASQHSADISLLPSASTALSPKDTTTTMDPHRPLLYRSAADKQRIEHEKTTLVRLRRALDTVITERMAHARPVLFHEVQNSLRNSTGRNVTLAHVAQIMYVAPSLYLVQAKEIRDYVGRAKEAHIIECGVDWVVPLSAKDFVKRADLLVEAIDKFFKEHPEADVIIPQAELPRIKILTDRDEWKKSDNLPPGVKAILEAQERVRKEEEEANKPKPKRTGTVAERMAALKARIAARKNQATSSSSSQ